MGKANKVKRISRLENSEAAKGKSSVGQDNDEISMSRKDDTISKLRELNQLLIGSLKEEREARKKMEDNGKESEREEITVLQQQLNDAVKQHSDSAQQYKVTETSLHQQIELLHKEVDGTRCLLEMQNQKVKDFLVENARLKKHLEENEEKTCAELESLHFEFANKYRELEEKHLKLSKENGEQENMIFSLQRHNASLENEKSLFLQSLKEETMRSQEISVNCLKSDQRVLFLEGRSLELQTELASAKSAYDDVVVQRNEIKENMNNLSNESRQIKEEKEALDRKLVLQLSINKELEEELLSTKSSFEELKESASKGEQQIAMLQRQLLDVAEKKDSQIIDIQCELCAMVIQLADLQDQLSSIGEEKRFLEERNAEIERINLVSEEEQVHLKGRIGELEAQLEFVTKDFESSRAMAVDKDSQLADLQNQLSELVEAKMCLQEENKSLRTELNKCTMASEQIVQLSDKIRELESALECVNKDLESRDNQIQQLMAERQHLQPHVDENGESNNVQEDLITGRGHEMPKQNSVHGNGKSNNVQEEVIRDCGDEKPKPNSVHEIGNPEEGGHANGKPKNVDKKQPPNRGRGKKKTRR